MKKIIEIKKLNYTYPDGTLALRDISMDIFQGDMVGIIGPNGAGKTTLLLHLNGILRGDGYIKVCDLDINKQNLNVIRQKVGLLFQDPEDQLFMPTVFDDIAFGPVNMGMDKEEVKKRVRGALEFVDMEGYGGRVSHHLSFGEKKRVSLATIISLDPEILVLDEPTGNLDPRHRKEFIRYLNEMEVTSVMSTHDIAMVPAICNKVAVMDRGMIVAFDTTENIFKNKELLKSYDLDQ
jgi:cobalt/nickel transport system ATP-binding protein